MKNFFLIFIMLFSIHSFGQLFARIDGGYSFPVYNKNLHHNFSDYYQIVDNSYSSRKWVDHKFNVGTGINLNGEIGYRLKEKFNFSLRFSYLNNKSKDGYNEFANRKGYYSTVFSDSVQFIYSVTNVIENYNSKVINFTPKISYCFFHSKKLIPEVAVGLSIYNFTIYRCDNYDNYKELSDISTSIPDTLLHTNTFKYMYFKNYYLRPYLSISVNYKINENIIFLINTSYHKLIFKADKMVQYYSEYNSNYYASVIDKNEYEKELPNEYFNLSNLEINFGLKYYFNKPAK